MVIEVARLQNDQDDAIAALQQKTLRWVALRPNRAVPT
jgi:hypothetical protein